MTFRVVANLADNCFGSSAPLELVIDYIQLLTENPGYQMPFNPDHPVFDLPSDIDQPIWRYMDMAKFVHLVLKKSLFLSRADLFGDPYECSLPRLVAEGLENYYKGLGGDLDEQMTRARLEIRDNSYVNCWHEAPYESAAMWDLYANRGLGVAVKSTVGRLADTLTTNLASDQEPFYGTRVRYIDYQLDTFPTDNLLWPLVHKRKSFEHEKEFRIVSTRLPQYESGKRASPENLPGLSVSVDPELLVQDVYVAPGSESWFLDVIQGTCSELGLNREVKQSSLDDDPFY